MSLKKTFIITALSGLVLLILAGGLLLYLWHHPPVLKSLLERHVARSLGYPVRMDRLSYSLRPLQVRVDGLSVGSRTGESGLHLQIANLSLGMERQGEFGDKTLILSPDLSGVSIIVSPTFKPGNWLDLERSPSFWSRLMTEATAFLLFDQVRIESVSLEQGRFQGDYAGIQAELRGISARLTPENRLVLSCRAELGLPARDIQLHLPALELSTPDGFSWSESVFTGRCRFARGRLSSPDLEAADLELELDGVYRSAEGSLGLEVKTLDLRLLRSGRPALEQLVPLTAQGKGQGVWDFEEKLLRVDRFQASLGELVRLQGGMRIRTRKPARMELHIETGRLQSARAWQVWSGAYPEGVGSMSVSGPIALSGSVRGRQEKGNWRFGLKIGAGLDTVHLELLREGLEIRTRVDGRIRVQGDWPMALEVQAELSVSDSLLSIPGLDLAPFSAHCSVTGSYPRFHLRQGRVEIPRAAVDLGGRGLVLEPLILKVPEGTFDASQGAWSVPTLQLSSSFVERLVLSVQHTPQKSEVTLKETDLRLADLARQLDLLPPGFEIQTEQAWQASLSYEPDGSLVFSSELGFEELQFRNRSEDILGEGLGGSFRLKGRFARNADRVITRAVLDVENGEVLVDRFYLNLQAHRLSAESSFEYQVQKRRFAGIDLQFGLQELLDLAVQGNLSLQERPEIHLGVRIMETSLQPVYHALVQEPYRMDYPFLSDLDLQGSGDGEFRVDGIENQWRIKGSCRADIRPLRLREKGLEFDGLHLEIPLWYESAVGLGAEDRTPGKLILRGFRAPGLPRQSLHCELRAGPNALSLPQGTSVTTLGGEVRLGPLRISQIFSKAARLETSLALTGFPLEPALRNLFKRSVQGYLSGELDPLVLQNGRIQSRGALRAEIFDGLIRFYDLRADKIFSPVPNFGLSATFHGLNLDEMTSKTDFGEIRGVLEGSVQDLEIAAGQPQAFDLLLQTVKTQGVDQKISVKAVDNIARIGGGQSPFMGFAGMMAAVFQNFSYRKIGIKAHLENDRFQINGTIKEDETEYLVKKRGLTGVNIVNSNPDNQISFKDMLKRIKRVTSSQGSVRVE